MNCAPFLTVLHWFSGLLPIWTALLVGLFLGWIWRPQWVNFHVSTFNDKLGILRSRLRLLRSDAKLSLVAQDESSQAMLPVDQRIEYKPTIRAETLAVDEVGRDGSPQAQQQVDKMEHWSPKNDYVNMVRYVVGEQDFRELLRRFYCKEGGLPWELMMQKAIPGMSYQAWRRDPQGGPTEYKSWTVFEDASPEIVKDFFWDDDFRSVWDNMLIYAKSLEECRETGAEVVHWIRKFPFFCSDREYLIGRRIFKYADTYFCITKGVPYLSVPRQGEPRRVDVYFSSWCIRPVESSRSGRKTACEVIFFHSEDMGIPKKIAKLGVKLGMWGCVKNMEPGLRKYQSIRKTLKTLSPSASIAQLVTEIAVSLDDELNADALSIMPQNREDIQHGNLLKWLVVGSAVVLACTIDRGIIGRTVVFGVAKQLGKLARRV